MTTKSLLEQFLSKYGEDGLRAAFVIVPPREEKILRLWVGLCEGESRPLNFKEIGKRCGLSGSRIGQIVSKALRELLDPPRWKSNQIEEILENWREAKKWREEEGQS